MQITISKQTAKTLVKAIWLTIGTCDKNRKEGAKFEPNEKVMKDLNVNTEQLYGLQQVGLQIASKLKAEMKSKK